MSLPVRKTSAQLVKERAVFDLTEEKLGLVRDMVLEACEKSFRVGATSEALQTLQYLACCSVLVSDRKELRENGADVTLDFLLVEEHGDWTELLSDLLEMPENVAWTNITDNASLFAALAEDMPLINSILNFAQLSLHLHSHQRQADSSYLSAAESCPHPECPFHHKPINHHDTRTHRASHKETAKTHGKSGRKHEEGLFAPSSLVDQISSLGLGLQMDSETPSSSSSITDRSTTEEEDDDLEQEEERKAQSTKGQRLHQRQEGVEHQVEAPESKKASMEGGEKKTIPTFEAWWKYQTEVKGMEGLSSEEFGAPSHLEQGEIEEMKKKTGIQMPDIVGTHLAGDRTVEVVDEWHKIRINTKYAESKKIRYTGPGEVRTRSIKSETKFPMGTVVSHAKWQQLSPHSSQGSTTENPTTQEEFDQQSQSRFGAGGSPTEGSSEARQPGYFPSYPSTKSRERQSSTFGGSSPHSVEEEAYVEDSPGYLSVGEDEKAAHKGPRSPRTLLQHHQHLAQAKSGSALKKDESSGGESSRHFGAPASSPQEPQQESTTKDTGSEESGSKLRFPPLVAAQWSTQMPPSGSQAPVSSFLLPPSILGRAQQMASQSQEQSPLETKEGEEGVSSSSRRFQPPPSVPITSASTISKESSIPSFAPPSIKDPTKSIEEVLQFVEGPLSSEHLSSRPKISGRRKSRSERDKERERERIEKERASMAPASSSSSSISTPPPRQPTHSAHAAIHLPHPGSPAPSPSNPQ